MRNRCVAQEATEEGAAQNKNALKETQIRKQKVNRNKRCFMPVVIRIIFRQLY